MIFILSIVEDVDSHVRVISSENFHVFPGIQDHFSRFVADGEVDVDRSLIRFVEPLRHDLAMTLEIKFLPTESDEVRHGEVGYGDRRNEKVRDEERKCENEEKIPNYDGRSREKTEDVDLQSILLQEEILLFSGWGGMHGLPHLICDARKPYIITHILTE